MKLNPKLNPNEMNVRCETHPTDDHIVVGLSIGMDEFGIDHGYVEAVDRSARTVLMSRNLDGCREAMTFDQVLDFFKDGIWYAGGAS